MMDHGNMYQVDCSRNRVGLGLMGGELLRVGTTLEYVFIIIDFVM